MRKSQFSVHQQFLLFFGPTGWKNRGPIGGPIGPHGFPWDPWVPMGSHGFPWDPMGPHGVPMASMENPRMSKIMDFSETHYSVRQKSGSTGSISIRNMFPLHPVTSKRPESPIWSKTKIAENQILKKEIWL